MGQKANAYVYKMQLSRTIKVEHRTERARVSVEKVSVLVQIVIVA